MHRYILFFFIIFLIACEENKPRSTHQKSIHLTNKENKSLPPLNDFSFECPKMNKGNAIIKDDYSFDIEIPIDLSFYIYDDLKHRHVSPNNFWLILNYKLALKLNESLLNKFINYDQDNFHKVRELIAYAYSYIIANHSNFPSLLIINYGKNKKFTISFNQENGSEFNITYCNESILSKLLVVPNKVWSSHEITGLVTCDNKWNSFEIKTLFNQQFNLSIPKENFKRNFFLKEFKITNYLNKTTLYLNNREVYFYMTINRESTTQSIKNISYIIKDEFGKLTSYKVPCREKKSLRL